MKMQVSSASAVSLGKISQSAPSKSTVQASQAVALPLDTTLAVDRLQTRSAVAPIPAAQSLAQLSQRTPADWGDVSIAERQQNLSQLREAALTLKFRNRPGVEIWTEMTQMAVENYADRNLSPQRKADFVMQDLAILFNGPDAHRHLQSYAHLPWVRSPDAMVQRFFDDWQLLGVPPADNDWEAVGYAGMGLDDGHGRSFRPRINDKTNNQIYHTFFYQFMGYVTQSSFNIRGGSMVHELRDGGTSSEDHNAMYVGMHTGLALRQMRDRESDAGLSDWAAMTRAAYSPGGGREVLSGAASPRVQAHHHKIQKLLDRPNLLHRAENGLIDAYKSLKQALGWRP